MILSRFWPLAALTTLGMVHAQDVLRAGESTFVITVRGTPGVTFHGNYLLETASGQTKNKLQGIAPAEFKVVGTAVYLTVQNQQRGGEMEVRLDSSGKLMLDRESPRANGAQYLEVELSKNGATVKKQRTDAPFGIVTLASRTPPGGSPRQTELQIEGSAKFAFITVDSGTGDQEQQLVPVPFSKAFFPKQGWIVGVTAQKARVVQPDHSHAGEDLQVLYDGKSGNLRVSVKVNGATLATDDTYAPYGVVNATATIP